MPIILTVCFITRMERFRASFVVVSFVVYTGFEMGDNPIEVLN